MKWQDIPALVRHSTVAIYNKSTGGGKDGFIKALRISRDTLAKAGYVYHGQKLAVLQEIKLTGKGWIRNRRHEAEGQSGNAKDAQFASLWKLIEPKLWELDGPSGEKPDNPKDIEEAAQREAAASNPGETDRHGHIRGGVYPPPKK